jgi:hypothetical protein
MTAKPATTRPEKCYNGCEEMHDERKNADDHRTNIKYKKNPLLEMILSLEINFNKKPNAVILLLPACKSWRTI